MPSIPLHLVTGFLGSGKTSFLIHYIERFGKDKKIGIVQNEFSSSSVDGEIIRKKTGSYRMLEINNGSVFCVCLLGEFVSSLAAFIDDNSLDEIIMEVSGMSDPISIGQIFQSPELKNKVFLGYSWAIVDARNFYNLTSIRSRIERQIRIADTIVLNKTDLAGNGIELIISDLKKINPFASIIRSTYAKIPFDKEKKDLKFFLSKENTDGYKPDLQSFVLKSSRIIDFENLRKFIDDLKSDIIRVKGYVNTGKKQKYLVQGCFDYYTFEEVEWFAEITQLVILGIIPKNVDYNQKFETFCDK